jgi:hypothetical protein
LAYGEKLIKEVGIDVDLQLSGAEKMNRIVEIRQSDNDEQAINDGQQPKKRRFKLELYSTSTQKNPRNRLS